MKALRRAEKALAMPEQEGEEAVEYSLRVPYFIFAMKAKADPLDTVEEILGFYAEREIDPLDQADAIVIDGVGILHNFPVPAFNYFRQDELPDPGWFLEFGEDDALANFLTRLQHLSDVAHPSDLSLRQGRSSWFRGIWCHALSELAKATVMPKMM